MSLHWLSEKQQQTQTRETNTYAEIATLVELLEQYVQEQDYELFTDTVQTIDWSQSKPDDMLRVLDLYLHLGMNQDAMQFAQHAAQYHPNHNRVQRAARVLAPSQGRVTHTSHPHELQASRDWVRNHAGLYSGQWVAVSGGIFIGVADTLQELKEIVTQKYALESVFMTKV